MTRCERKHNSSHFLKKYLCSEYQKYPMILACWIRKGIINCDSRDLIVLMGQEQKIKNTPRCGHITCTIVIGGSWWDENTKIIGRLLDQTLLVK